MAVAAVPAASLQDKKKYKYMENTLQIINKRHVSLSQVEVQQNNQILKEILDILISKMKSENRLFNSMYSRVFYGGSYYDELRVGQPTEFDLDLLFILPKYAEPTLTISDAPGFVNLQINALDKYRKQPESKNFEGMDRLLDGQHYLLATKVHSWMEGIINKALNALPTSGNARLFVTQHGSFKGTLSKSGPALTLQLRSSEVYIDIDLVPCFVFKKDKWPPSPYRQPEHRNNFQNEFFIVPKQPPKPANIRGRYWRLSFQEQEREMIRDLRQLKPTVKLLKLLRDNEKFIIASYYIKTVFLWELEEHRSMFTGDSLSYVFMFMLKKLQTYIQNESIPFFWYKENNLLQGKIDPLTLRNISNRLSNIIKDIDRSDDASVVERYLGRSEETPEKLQTSPPVADKKWWCLIL